MDDDYRHEFCNHIDKAIWLLDRRRLTLSAEIGGHDSDCDPQSIKSKIAARRAVIDATRKLERIVQEFIPEN